MAFTKIAAAGIDTSGSVVIQNLNTTGVSTLGNTVVGGATTQLVVTGDARITGILTIGTSSVTLDGTNNQVNVGTGVTLHHINGVQVGSNTLHSSGLTLNTLNVGTGGTIITTTTGGLVGIGITNPNSQLYVKSSAGSAVLKVADSSNTYIARLQSNAGDGSVNLFNEANYPLTFGTNNVERVRIDSNGNLGIGTTNPINTLHVVGNSRFISDNYPAAFFGTGAGLINFGYRDGEDGAELSSLSSMGQGRPLFLNATGSGAVLINSSTSTGTASQRLQVTGGAYVSGNLGVGATNPQNPLHISGSPGTLLRLDGGVAGTGTRDIVITEANTTAYGGIIRYDSTADLFTFGTIDNSVVKDALNVARTTGLVDCKYGVKAPKGWYYSNSYTTSSTWNSGWNTVIPTNALAPNSTYLVSLYWDWNGYGSQPYYLYAATLLTTVNSTNGSSTENEVILLSSTHTGGTGTYLRVRTIAQNGGGTNGLQVNIAGFSPTTGSVINVYVQQLGY